MCNIHKCLGEFLCNFSFGCKIVSISVGYLKSALSPNVDLQWQYI